MTAQEILAALGGTRCVWPCIVSGECPVGGSYAACWERVGQGMQQPRKDTPGVTECWTKLEGPQ